MTITETNSIKYIEPVQCAWERMVTILFRPFNLGKWFALGFSAWLATLLDGAGGNFNSSSSGGDSHGSSCPTAEQFSSFIDQYGAIIIAIVVAVAFFMILFCLLLSWIQARGHFMFLDNVITNRSLIKRPWREFKRQGNSLFLWNIIIGVIVLLAMGVIFAVGALSIWPYIHNHSYLALAIIGGSVAGFLTLLIIVIGSYIGCFLNDFVSPIMRAGNLTVIPAWRRFLGIFRESPGVFLLYGLFKIGVLIVASMCIMTLMVVTCCFCCIILIPYVGTVLMLPALVFYRALGPEFLAQFDSEFELPSPEVSPPPSPAAKELPANA